MSSAPHSFIPVCFFLDHLEPCDLPVAAVKRIFGEASEKNLYLSQLIILDTLEKCLAGVSLPSEVTQKSHDSVPAWPRPPPLWRQP